MTPNRSELADAVGGWSTRDELNEKASQLLVDLGLEVLVVTMSEQGIKLFTPTTIFHDHAQAKEVFDVSGAGDTVISALAIMRGCGMDWEHSIMFANAAGGVAVGKLGTSVVQFEEVEAFLSKMAAA